VAGELAAGGDERRWRENDKKREGQFRLARWMIAALSEIGDAPGGGFGYFAARVVRSVLRERGVGCDARINVTPPVDGFKEVDLFCP